MSALFGVLCRLLWFSSLAYDCKTNVTLELSTPRSVAPDAVSLCTLDSSEIQKSTQVALQSLQQAGDLWQQAAGRELIGHHTDSTAARASRSFTLGVSDLATELATDLYYTSRDASDWHIFMTGQEAVVMALLQSSAAWSSSSSSGVASSSAKAAKTNGTCVTISGPWEANTRYKITITLQNPAAPVQPPAVPPKPPSLWMAPLQYIVQYNSSGHAVGRSVRVRGDKQGQICSLRPQVEAVLPGMFSPCSEAAARGWVPAGESNAEACLEALQQGLAAAADPAALRSVFPFTTPPFAAGGPDSAPDTACAEGSLLSPAFRGECIDCSNAAIEGATCRCLPGYISNLIGPAACGPPISLTGNASNAAALAAQLCDTYAEYYNKMLQGELADRLVRSMYLDAFMQQAAFLVDWGFLQQANASFWQQHVVDERMPSSSSRRTGVGSKCTSCDRHGKFKDIYTKEKVPVLDDRFSAVQTFRLIGYMLSTAGFPCPALWDPQDPFRKMYGRYEKTMCAN